MQFIAASKMRRAQQMVLAGRPYSQRIQAVLADLVQTLTSQDEELNIPLLDDRTVNRTALLLITPDRGLCGALVGNIQRTAGEVIHASDSPVEVIAVGRKGENLRNPDGADAQGLVQRQRTAQAWKKRSASRAWSWTSSKMPKPTACSSPTANSSTPRYNDPS